MAEVSPFSTEHLYRPRPGPGVCIDCFNTTYGRGRCFSCRSHGRFLDAIVPISYSVAHEPLHHVLWRYKRASGPWAERAREQLTAILNAFLTRHEPCVAAVLGRQAFDIITTVPSSVPARDEHHPLRQIVGERCAATRGRHERLLARTSTPCAARSFDPGRFIALRPIDDSAVLLIDDTWTTGASAHSAAAALKAAGARQVAAVVVGRHLSRGWHENDLFLRTLRGSFDFSTCVICECAPALRCAS